MSEQVTAPRRMRERLAELRAEYGKGQEQLRGLVAQETATREALLRVSGAIKVLEEMVSQEGDGPDRKQGESVDGASPPAPARAVNVP
ncbi:hypothetical protein ACIGPN_29115 [Streptomyces afghaniensis]|uniref:hypothetical protein n=1 Tax=Streptomyces TaxID=1883 RepID=UPI001FAFFCB2|nr:hypothetical protein [Streptomyces sp. HP-A2021]UOB15370.1 hypothetical protein MQE23_42870 [Streptomyces sp. HP-A2021]